VSGAEVDVEEEIGDVVLEEKGAPGPCEVKRTSSQCSANEFSGLMKSLSVFEVLKMMWEMKVRCRLGAGGDVDSRVR
jgi:hypothetical protein